MAQGIMGRLAAVDLVGATDTVVYTVPENHIAQVQINIVNRGPDHVHLRLALCAEDTPELSEYLEYDTQLLTGGSLEKTGVVLDATKRIVVRIDKEDVADAEIAVNVHVLGVEVSTI